MDKNMMIWVKETGSTNSLLSRWSRHLPDGAVVVARSQVAGRGQRGNRWLSAPGMNLTMSMLLRGRGVEVSRSYGLSEAVALAITDLLRSLGVEALVKWPNDIYVGRRKIAGILIENQLEGQVIERSIVGIGLNVNQTSWPDELPAAVSIASLTSGDWSVDTIAAVLQQAILERLSQDEDERHAALMSRLWRGRGYWPWHDVVRGEDVEARIVAIAPSGRLTLELRDGSRREYMFKEVQCRL